MWYGKESVYQEKFKDPMGIFFTKEEFPELETASDDVSGVLQDAIDRLIAEQSYGIVYIPEGEYRIKKTVRIPRSVRLIGYGKKRPLFILPAHTEGFDGGDIGNQNDPRGVYWNGYPGANYMFWFTRDTDTRKDDPKDADAGTFYSALSNMDFKIEAGNPGAICIRAHFAQHGFISHCHFDLGDGLAGLFDVGNEMEDLTFEGGKYGIVCRMCSPGWPFALLDSAFDGQRTAAILTTTTGFTGFRLKISNTPKAFDLYIPGSWEKLYLEDCIFSNIAEEAITSYMTDSIIQQMNLKRLYCENVHTLLKRAESGETVTIPHAMYVVEDYAYGYIMEEGSEAAQQEILQVKEISALPELQSDIPPVPSMDKWVSVFDYGAKGDGKTDDTRALQAAVSKESVLYFPQGIYKISDTITLKKDITLIGMSPVTTQIIIEDDEPAFEGFGTPKALVETAVGGHVYLNGIGIDTAGKNPRAAGIKWMGDETSYMNDVKFMGGHGLMYRDGRNPFACLYNATRTADYDPDRVWDFQYSSLWVTNGGGGVFKDVWSASPYAEAGIAITYTETPGRMYAISLEHHVRCEMKLNRVKNWSFYALQTEEEKAEGMECLPLELVDCENITFANLFMFRVVAVDRTYDTAIKMWDCKDIYLMNVHNKAQMQHIFPLTAKEENSGFFAKSPEYARVTYYGKDTRAQVARDGAYDILSQGYNFVQGAIFDAEGNLYWCDKVQKKIFRYDVKREKVKPFYDIHFVPSALAVDSAGNLLVAVDYTALKKTIPGQPFISLNLTEYHPFFSWFHNRGEKAYAVSLANPYDSMVTLEKQDASDCTPEVVYRPTHLAYEGMYNEVMSRPIASYYMAPDGKTAMEGIIDIGRSMLLGAAVPGEKYILTDDSMRKTYVYDVTEGGNVTDGRIESYKGQYGGVLDEDGILWTVDDKLYGTKDGKVIATKEVPWDAYAVVKNDGVFYVLGRRCLYRLRS